MTATRLGIAAVLAFCALGALTVRWLLDEHASPGLPLGTATMTASAAILPPAGLGSSATGAARTTPALDKLEFIGPTAMEVGKTYLLPLILDAGDRTVRGAEVPALQWDKSVLEAHLHPMDGFCIGYPDADNGGVLTFASCFDSSSAPEGFSPDTWSNIVTRPETRTVMGRVAIATLELKVLTMPPEGSTTMQQSSQQAWWRELDPGLHPPTSAPLAPTRIRILAPGK